MSGVLLVTGSISPTMVLKRTMASNKLTPEQNIEHDRDQIKIILGTEVRWPVPVWWCTNHLDLLPR